MPSQPGVTTIFSSFSKCWQAGPSSKLVSMNLQSHMGTLMHLPVIGRGWSRPQKCQGRDGTVHGSIFAQQLPIELQKYTWYENITNLLYWLRNWYATGAC